MSRADLIQEIVENLAKCQRPALNTGWKASGLSHAQLSMLYMIHYHHKSSPKHIAEYLGISKSAVTQLMEPLVDKGFVLRSNDPHDRRVIQLSLTADGKKLLHQLNKFKYAGIRSGLESLDTDDLEKLNKLHQKMLAGITKQK